MKRIAECRTCMTEAFVSNAPNVKVPTPIYGAYGLGTHAGHYIVNDKR